jgi:UDP-glucose 4-epimerase
MNKLIITGALGHIGSQLIRALPLHFPDREIVLIDNFLTQRYCSLFNLPDTGNYTFLEADILSCDLSAIIGPSDIVIHLAAVTDAANSFSNPELVEQVNLTGTRVVADVCALKAAKLVFLSTTSVYGTQNEVVDENCTAEELQPQSPYAASKLAAERYLMQLGAERGLSYVICRFGTIFGTSIGMRFHTAVNKFSWQAVMGQPITVWRTALHQRRPYLHLDDGIAALIHIISNDLFRGELFNVLTVNATVNEIVTIISEVVEKVTIHYVDQEIMNQLSYTVSSQKFRDTGFAFKGDLGAGIRETLELLKNARN